MRREGGPRTGRLSFSDVACSPVCVCVCVCDSWLTSSVRWCSFEWSNENTPTTAGDPTTTDFDSSSRIPNYTVGETHAHAQCSPRLSGWVSLTDRSVVFFHLSLNSAFFLDQGKLFLLFISSAWSDISRGDRLICPKLHLKVAHDIWIFISRPTIDNYKSAPKHTIAKWNCTRPYFSANGHTLVPNAIPSGGRPFPQRVTQYYTFPTRLNVGLNIVMIDWEIGHVGDVLIVKLYVDWLGKRTCPSDLFRVNTVTQTSRSTLHALAC